MSKISERTLRKWRREALVYTTIETEEKLVNVLSKENGELRRRMLNLTQQLLDQYLLENKEKKQ